MKTRTSFKSFILLLCLCLLCSQAAAARGEDAGEGGNVLRIACAPEVAVLFDEAIEKYESAHPDSRVELKEMDLGAIRESLYGEEAGIDLYYVSSNFISLPFLIQSKLIAPLSSQAAVSDIFTMYPQAQDYVAGKGQYWGYPMELRGIYWGVNRALMEEYELDDIPASLPEYFSLMKSWFDWEGRKDCDFTEGGSGLDSQRNAFDSAVVLYLNYLAAEGRAPTFDTPEFGELLKSMAFMPDEEAGSIGPADQSIFCSTGFSPLYGVHDADFYMLTPAVREGAEPCVTGYLSFLVVSAASGQKDRANDFIEACLGDGMDPVRAGLYPHRVTGLEHGLEKAGTPTDGIRVYRRLVSHMVLDQGPLIGCLRDSGCLWETACRDEGPGEEDITELELRLKTILLQLAADGWVESD